MITTNNIHGRDDYFGASASVGNMYYFGFAETRQEAFDKVLKDVWETLKEQV